MVFDQVVDVGEFSIRSTSLEAVRRGKEQELSQVSIVFYFGSLNIASSIETQCFPAISIAKF